MTISTTHNYAAASAKRPAADEDASIRPFRVDIPQAALDDLRRRVCATRWPDQETVTDRSQGVPLERIRALVEHWGTGYDWRRVEATLNALPQFVTRLDGVDIHFVHVRSRHPQALPLVITHGWPGSVLELVKAIAPLTDPTAHGGRAEDAFDVVLPSLPGYGFSGKPTSTGWDPVRIARVWTMLMERLGYARFGAQGGDWGAIVTEQMGAQAPAGLLGIHTNLPSAVPDEVSQALLSGGGPPPGLAADERQAFDRLRAFFTHGLAYAQEMASRPQTVGYGLSDSPAGLAAWHYEKFTEWTDSGGEAERSLTQDEMLDDITLYWLTNSASSSARLYWENKLAFFAPMGVAIPVAVSAFPGDVYQAPRSWAERAYPKLVHYNQPARGGHFAAWEEPQLFAEEVRAAFRSLR